MKFFKLFFLLPFFLLIIACQNDANSIVNKVEKNEINSFLLSVDSLNQHYKTYTTRFNFRKWGTRFLSAVVDGCVGTVASAATTPVGGTIIGTGASWAYEEYLDNIDKKAQKVNLDADVPSAILVNNISDASLIDSVGYYHNKILSKISFSGKKYTSINGQINFNELIKDITNIMSDLTGCNEKISLKKQTRLSSCIKEFIHTLTFDDNMEKSFSAFEKTDLEISSNELSYIKEMCNKVSQTVVYLDNETAINYGKELYKVIESSNLSKDEREKFKLLDNILVNSKLYWENIK